MKEYQFSINGYYVEESENPTSSLSHNCTNIAPILMDGFIPRWNGSAWEQVENHIGENGFVNGEEYEVNEYGPLPDGWSLTPPPKSLEEVKADKLAEISAAYNEYDSKGTVMTSKGFPLQVGQEHCTKLDGAIRFAEMVSQPKIYITDADNVTHYDITLAEAKQLLIEQMAAAMAAHTRKQTLRQLVNAAESVAAVEAVVW